MAALITDHVTDEAKIPKKLIVGDHVIFTAIPRIPVLPEHIRPVPVDFPHDPFCRGIIGRSDTAFQLGFEMLKSGQRLPSGIHLDIQLIGQTHVFDRKEVKCYGSAAELSPEIFHISEFSVDRVKHNKHGADRGILLPIQRKPRLIDDLFRKASREGRLKSG